MPIAIVPGMALLVLGLTQQIVRAAEPRPTLARIAANASGNEIRLGLQAHDPWSPEHGSADLAFTLLFAVPPAITTGWAVLTPRPHIGAALNTTGKTSHLHAGLTWTFDLTPAVFLEASIGAAVHTGQTGRNIASDRSAMGCSLHFREAGAIGYRLNENWSVMTTLEHLSNAGLCSRNRGLTNLGVMVGYRF
jgi:lipid A 3-O-deacylase